MIIPITDRAAVLRRQPCSLTHVNKPVSMDEYGGSALRSAGNVPQIEILMHSAVMAVSGGLSIYFWSDPEMCVYFDTGAAFAKLFTTVYCFE